MCLTLFPGSQAGQAEAGWASRQAAGERWTGHCTSQAGPTTKYRRWWSEPASSARWLPGGFAPWSRKSIPGPPYLRVVGAPWPNEAEVAMAQLDQLLTINQRGQSWSVFLFIFIQQGQTMPTPTPKPKKLSFGYFLGTKPSHPPVETSQPGWWVCFSFYKKKIHDDIDFLKSWEKKNCF